MSVKFLKIIILSGLALLVGGCIGAAGKAGEILATEIPSSNLPWWNDEIFYEVFVRSFYDSDGDGMGDIAGLTEKLDYLNDGDPNTSDDLGVTGLWLMPVMEAASYHGYDVADYRQIEQDYGTEGDFRELIDAVHDRGMVLIVDLVINHTSVEHPWFVASSANDETYLDWYVWEDDNPGYLGAWNQPVWHEYDERFYYGTFWSGMPDLDLQNPQVTQEIQAITQFWLGNMDVDGFRLDAIRHLVEEGDVQENTTGTHEWLSAYHDYVRSVNPDALLVGEVWTSSVAVAPYVGDEVDIAFEFDLAAAIVTGLERGNADLLVYTQNRILELYAPGQYAAFITNHDQNRVMYELGGNTSAAEVAAVLLLTNPGVPFIYYGEEVGMSGAKPDERIRTPFPWNDDPNTAGFTTADEPWQSLSDGYQDANVAVQSSESDSLLDVYKRLIHLRHSHPALRYGELLPLESSDARVYGYLRRLDDQFIMIVVNLSDEEVTEYNLHVPGEVVRDGMILTDIYANRELLAFEDWDQEFIEYAPLSNLAPYEIVIGLASTSN